MEYKLLILFLISLKYQNTLSASDNFQTCTIKGKNGVCKLLKDCPQAVQELNYENKFYTRCIPEYEGYNPRVCCLPTKNKLWRNLPVSERSIKSFYFSLYKNWIT